MLMIGNSFLVDIDKKGRAKYRETRELEKLP